MKPNHSQSALEVCLGAVMLLGAPLVGAPYAVKDVYPLGSGAYFPTAYVFGLSLNGNGEVAGYALGGLKLTNVLEHGFVYSKGAVIDFATLPAFAECSATWAKAVNGKGEVAGEAVVVAGDGPVGRAFVYSGGRLTTFGSGAARANAINDLGEVTGRSSNRAFLFSGGTLSDLGTLGGISSEGRGINSAGQVVGFSTTTNGDWHAFLYSEGRMRDLGTLGGGGSDAYAISGQGDIVGSAMTASGETHAFLYSAGRMADLGTLGGPLSQATGLNDLGDIVGLSSTADGRTHAFLYRSGVMTDLNTLVPPGTALELDEARAVNNAGQIAGTGHYVSPSGAGTAPVAYLLTPLPVLVNPRVSEGAFRVSVSTAPGAAYVPEYSDRLPATNWAALQPFTGDGGAREVTWSIGPSQQFFRLRLQ